MFVNDDVVSTDEVLGVMVVEGPPPVTLTIEELVCISGSLVVSALEVHPDFPQLDDPRRRLVTIGKEPTEPERQCPAGRLLD
jgi:hypothetical protein